MTFRRTRCPHCKAKLEPMQRIHAECIEPYADAEEAKAQRKAEKQARMQAKVEKAADRKKREQQKTIPQIEEECRRIVQKIARLRDKDDGCISCELPASWDGQWHGSHFRSHGAASAVQFHLWNINKACWICNKLYSGRINQYEPKLVEKIGQDRVDWLKAQNHQVRNTREYLARFKAVMGKRLRRMEKRHEH